MIYKTKTPIIGIAIGAIPIKKVYYAQYLVWEKSTQ